MGMEGRREGGTEGEGGASKNGQSNITSGLNTTDNPLKLLPVNNGLDSGANLKRSFQKCDRGVIFKL